MFLIVRWKKTDTPAVPAFFATMLFALPSLRNASNQVWRPIVVPLCLYVVIFEKMFSNGGERSLCALVDFQVGLFRIRVIRSEPHDSIFEFHIQAPLGSMLDFYSFIWAEMFAMVGLVICTCRYFLDSRPEAEQKPNKEKAAALAAMAAALNAKKLTSSSSSSSPSLQPSSASSSASASSSSSDRAKLFHQMKSFKESPEYKESPSGLFNSDFNSHLSSEAHVPLLPIDRQQKM